MKKLILLSVLLSFKAMGAPCNGAPGALHINLNGAPGGFVAKTATVSKTVVVDSNSSVCEKATVQGFAKITSGSEITGHAQIEGNANLVASKVKGEAKVFGNSIVTNSRICQASMINFNVTNSEYYCQTDDEEPKHPGELGEKTLLGIDSDVDGVRDDVEIWINNNTSNTPTKNMYNARMALKQLARNVQVNMKYKDNRERSVQIGKEILNSFECLRDVVSDEEYVKFSGDVQVELYCTMDRLKAWAKNQGNMSGEKLSVDVKKKKGATCTFALK